MKKIICLLFIMGFSLTAFSQLHNYEYREGINKKKIGFKAPVIRLGTLSDSSFIPPIMVDPAVLDTQAIYLVTVEVDSIYIVAELDSVASETVVDTIQKIGAEIYNLGLEKNLDYEDNSWELIQEYLTDNKFTIDTINDQTVSLPDTQFFYVLTEKVDSILVINETKEFTHVMIVDSLNIDTFYQVGAEIFQDDLASSIEEKDWVIIREELLSDSILNISLEDLTYEEYLETKINQPQDTVLVEQRSIFEPIVLDKKIEPIKIDTIIKQEKVPLASGVDLQKKANTIDQNSSTVNDVNSKMVNSRLLEMEKKLDAIRAEQSKQANEIKVAPTPTQAPIVPAADIIELQKRIRELEAQAPQNKDPELERMKRQLWLYEKQNKEQEGRELQIRMNENEKLKAEIDLLRKAVNTAQQRQDTKLIAVAPTETPQEINQLRTEVASANQNIEIMKQLWLQQQIIESLKSEAQPVVSIKDPASDELVLLRQEIAELKAGISSAEKAPPTVIAVPIEKDKGEIDTLRQQILSLQQDLKAVKEVKPAKPMSVMDMIRGREKQIIFFKIGAFKLSNEAISQVASMAQLMLQYDTLEIALEAHTDPSGDATKNLLLSKKRAESVKESILKFGISPNRIFLDFRGEDTQSDPAFGRRVEMILKVN